MTEQMKQVAIVGFGLAFVIGTVFAFLTAMSPPVDYDLEFVFIVLAIFGLSGGIALGKLDR